MHVGWLALLALAGCVDPGVVHCADGTVCPAGTRCGEPAGCVSPGDCGDGVVTGEEVCDDGNRVSGDGCSATCDSRETCGNGVLDALAGEACDDGNHASHDGCSSACLVETPRWQNLGPGPGIRAYAASTWDPDRGQVVLAGGETPPPTGTTVRYADTWFWSRRVWTRGPDLPTPLTRLGMANDHRGHTIVLGGEPVGGACTVTTPENCRACLSLEDAAWVPCASTIPEGRMGHVLTTSRGGGVVAFGGLPGGKPYQWRDGVWTLTADPARTRTEAGGAFDPIAGLSYVVGGSGDGVNETLAFDGATWSPAGNVLGRFSARVVYDPGQRVLLAFGGQVPQTTLLPDSVVVLRNGQWRDAGAVPGPIGRFAHVMVYDPIEQGAIVFGGGAATPNSTIDTWLLRWESATPDERCDGSDADGDGDVGCADPDCWARCTPRCPPGASCDPGEPRCGDGVCNPYLEDAALCPDDC